MNIRILVVDDEEDLCEIIQYNLEKAGYQVDVVYSAEEALNLDLSVYHLFLLDVMMGEMSGFKLGTLLKKSEATKNIPIIYSTAKDTETDKLAGFSIGADDYISKPFSIKEMIARVKAVLKRSMPTVNGGEEAGVAVVGSKAIVEFKELVLNLTDRTAWIGNTAISLTKTEFELLSLFLRKQDIALSREDILNAVWKGEEVSDRTIDVNITRLRRKIIPYDKHLVTRQSFGYCFSTQQ